LNYYYEKLLIFNDWNDYYPILNDISVDNPEEAKLEFFTNINFLDDKYDQIYEIDYNNLE
jgi:hypothetical protein